MSDRAHDYPDSDGPKNNRRRVVRRAARRRIHRDVQTMQYQRREFHDGTVVVRASVAYPPREARRHSSGVQSAWLCLDLLQATTENGVLLDGLNASTSGSCGDSTATVTCTSHVFGTKSRYGRGTNMIYPKRHIAQRRPKPLTNLLELMEPAVLVWDDLDYTRDAMVPFPSPRMNCSIACATPSSASVPVTWAARARASS
jgi:hypothetical protein